MKVKELKILLNGLPDDTDVEINSICNEAGEYKTSPINDWVYSSEDELLALTPEQIILPTYDDIDVENIMSVRAVSIEWDTDGQDIDELYLLPEMDIPLEVAIDDGEIDEDAIGNYISEESGFCHYGFNIAVVVTKFI